MRAFTLGFRDLEDALQAVAAEACTADHLVTRNETDFAKSPVHVLTLVERGGNKRSKVVANVTAKNLRAAVVENVETGSCVHTDEFKSHKNLKNGFKHSSVNHTVTRQRNVESRRCHDRMTV